MSAFMIFILSYCLIFIQLKRIASCLYKAYQHSFSDLSQEQASPHGGIRVQRQRLRPRLRCRASGDLLQVASRKGRLSRRGRRDPARRTLERSGAGTGAGDQLSGDDVGFTIGNDMSSRDIEGENLLYLPQAKIYTSSCAVGPWIVVGPTEDDARQWTIQLEIRRGGETVFAGETRAGQIKRPFAELVDYLFRSQTFPNGAVLLTGAGIVPPGFVHARSARRRADHHIRRRHTRERGSRSCDVRLARGSSGTRRSPSARRRADVMLATVSFRTRGPAAIQRATGPR